MDLFGNPFYFCDPRLIDRFCHIFFAELAQIGGIAFVIECKNPTGFLRSIMIPGKSPNSDHFPPLLPLLVSPLCDSFQCANFYITGTNLFGQPLTNHRRLFKPKSCCHIETDFWCTTPIWLAWKDAVFFKFVVSSILFGFFLTRWNFAFKPKKNAQLPNDYHF